MRSGNTTLIIICAVSVIVSGIMARKLHEKQQSIATTRDLVSRVPLAGFHKFAADIEWMRFIYFCGGLKRVDDDNIKEIDIEQRQQI